MIRRFFPKKNDLKIASKNRVKEIGKMINNRPIRKLDYLRPLETLKNRWVAFMG
ncbi:MAG: IS30 family transposase [Flavobacteriales bacterium]